mgnify:CR=1 FL=1|jgi:hypothetical protein|tara:strand:- start:9390 stop:9677 length:288 start_codon:yes stop_codon:yes gene_type:complete
MADVTDGRSFHPRLTNLGTCEFTFALSLPRFHEPAVEDVQAPREPAITNPLLDRLAKILQNTSVAYLCVFHGSISLPDLLTTSLTPRSGMPTSRI